MQFKMVHNNLNVFDLDKSIAFYQQALNLTESRRITHPEGAFIIVYLKDEQSNHLLELTWMRDRTTPYNLGDNEIHLAFVTKDFDQALAMHKEMGVVCYENPDMGIYFINDPDGYWLEVIPVR